MAKKSTSPSPEEKIIQQAYAKAKPPFWSALLPFLPRWLELFLGRQLLRFCPEAKQIEDCEGCELRALCGCAHQEFLQAAAVERRVWAVLVGCGGAVILYAVCCSLR